jgi:hypothetical protein
MSDMMCLLTCVQAMGGSLLVHFFLVLEAFFLNDCFLSAEGPWPKLLPQRQLEAIACTRQTVPASMS